MILQTNECGWIWPMSCGLPTPVPEPKTDSSLMVSSGEEGHNFVLFLVLYSPGIHFTVCLHPLIFKQSPTSSSATRPTNLQSMKYIWVLTERSLFLCRFIRRQIMFYVFKCGRVYLFDSKRRIPVGYCVQDFSLIYSRTEI